MIRPPRSAAAGAVRAAMSVLLLVMLLLLAAAAPACGFVPSSSPCSSPSCSRARPLPCQPLAAAPLESGGGGNGDFDPNPIMEGGGGEGPPPADMLARIFRGAQARRASGKAGDWASYTDSLRGGVVLVANPKVFLDGGLDPRLADRFFLPMDLSLEVVRSMGPNAVDSLANVLPVVLLLGSGPAGTTGLVLNRRTGYLVGDLNVESSGFKVQPVHLGGTSEGQGLVMLHTYPDIPNAQQVTLDGLNFGGNYTAAQELVKEGRAVSSRFKFFIQQTVWAPGQLRQEVEDAKMWFPASVSKDVLLKNRGREGPKMVKPLWTEVMEMMGGTFKEMRDELYGETDEEEKGEEGDGGTVGGPSSLLE